MVKDRFVQADGGLVRALSHFIKNNKAVWLGCGERSFHDGGIDYKAVKIPKAIYKSYYANFSNRVLWLALHGMKPFIDGAADWPHYEHANALFAAQGATYGAFTLGLLAASLLATVLGVFLLRRLTRPR